MMTSFDRDFHPADNVPSRAHGHGALRLTQATRASRHAPDVAFNSPFRVIAFHSAQYAHAIAPYAGLRKQPTRTSKSVIGEKWGSCSPLGELLVGFARERRRKLRGRL